MIVNAAILLLLMSTVQLTEETSVKKKLPVWMRYNQPCMKKNITNGCSTMRLKCTKKNHVILSLSLHADSSKWRRMRPKSCKGWGRKLLTEIQNCHWKNKCKIQFRQEIIVKSRDPRRRHCPGKLSQSLRLENYTCVREDVIYDICKSQTPIRIEESNVAAGIIRSHECYPWNYQMDDFKGSKDQNDIAFCKITLDPFVGSYVAISVLKFDIYYKDYLTINATDLGANVATKHAVTKGKSHWMFEDSTTVKIEFGPSQAGNRETDNVTRGQGFLLCFKFLKKGQTIQGSVCDAFEESVKTTKDGAKRSCRKRRCSLRTPLPKCKST